MAPVDFTTIHRLTHFIMEMLVGLGIILVMLTISIVVGTVLISSFGDTGGFIWLGISYVLFLCFYPLYEKVRQFLPKQIN